jgi:putative transposase
MPWREMSPVEQRLEFVTEYLGALLTMTELAAQYGISRKTAYKWLDRYKRDGIAGLADHSRRPHHSPQASDPALMEQILAVRRRHPRWGAQKLLTVAMRATADGDWPSRATICRRLAAAGLITARGRRRPIPPPPSPLTPIAAANDVWTTDFKGEFRTGDGVYCYPLTLRDAFSRFVLRCDALDHRTYAATRSRFERAFAAYGLPTRIRSDNGTPFAGSGFARLSRLCIWWIRLGIVPERIAPGHPEQNGSHEQFHRVLKAETTRPPSANRSAQQRRFGRFCREYNHERPHAALDDAVPAARYSVSPRAYPRRLPALEYPGHMEIRRVSPIGQISWRGTLVFVSDSLAGEDIAFEEIDDGVWTIFFGSVVLGRFDERDRRLQPIDRVSAGRFASCAGSAPAPKNKC